MRSIAPSTPLKLAATVLALLLTVACNDGGSSLDGDKKQEKKKDPDQPPAQVELPEPPPASELKIEEKNPDGTFRVKGLIAHRGKHLGKKVSIKGVITHISEECDPKEAKETGEECPEPHMFIRDEEGADNKLMVVGHRDKFVEEAELETGQEHVFTGTYKKLAQGFVASEHGLLYVDKVDDMNVVEEKK